METGALIWQIESEMLDNLLGLIMRGAVGSAEWQPKKLQELGLLREINAKTIKAHREEVAEAVRQELARRTGQKVAIVNNALGIAGYSVTADPRVSGILANYQNAVAVKMETIYSTMLRSAGEKYVETVQVATAKAQLGMSGRKAVAEIVKGWSDKGLPGFRDAAGREWTPEAYASVLTRTSGTQCATEGQLSRMDELGLDLVEVSSHVGARPGCAPYQGRIFYRNTPVEGYDSLYKDTTYGEPDGLFGINCVLEGTVVFGPSENAIYRRKYTGELITIRTAAGNKLTITPNHPILTDGGWVNANLLKIGDNVISRTGLDREGRVSPDPNHGITTVEQKFNAFLNDGDVFLLPSSSCNFHGDIPNHDVNVVFRKGFLWNGGNTTRDKHIKQRLFRSAAETTNRLKGFSSFNKAFFGSLNSFYSVVCRVRNSITPLFTTAFMNVLHGLRFVVSNRNAKIGKIFPNSAFANTNKFGNFVLPHARVIHSQKIVRKEPCLSKEIILPVLSAQVDPLTLKTISDCLNGTVILSGNGAAGSTGEIQADRIVDIKRESTHSSFVHVYNLETELGWYYSNNIISHNCKHVMYPYIPGTKETFKPYPEERNEAAYKNSQIQRKLERNIRGAKRELSNLQKTGVESEIQAAKEKVSRGQSAMRQFIDQSGRRRDYDREQIRG